MSEPIILQVKYLKSVRERTIGLIMSDTAYPVVLYTRFGIHTFGLRFAIDVLILNKDNTVVTLSEHLRPNRLFLWNPMHTTVVELPAGDVKKAGIKKGSKLKLRFV